MADFPLAGVSIAVTRTQEQAGELAAPLAEVGARVLVTPLIRIAPAVDSESVQQAVQQLNRFAWLVFSSANGVELFRAALKRWGSSLEALAGLRIACVGPATAAAARRLGLATDVIPEEFVGDALANSLAERIGRGTPVLLARAGGAREQLPASLRIAGAVVTDIELYRSVPDEVGAGRLRNHMRADEVDVVTFTSGSTVRYFAEYVGHPGRALVAAIGPVTADKARQHGMDVLIEADPHTTGGLVNAIVEYFRRGQRPSED